jgi:hypothetical protein
MTRIAWANRAKAIGGPVAGIGLLGALLLAAAPSANAAPYQGGNYGAYQYEGLYPTTSGCAGTFREIYRLQTSGPRGASATLILFYSSRCGAFARIENVHDPVDVIVDVRLNRSNSGAHTANGYVGETPDGLSYAYTKIGNDLSGRVAQAQVNYEISDPFGPRSSVATGWY